LASVYFSFLARKNRRIEDLGLAFLAAALATGVKASNLPLMLPILFALWPSLGLLRSRPFVGAAIILLSVVVSFAPLALLNQAYTGQWAGDPGNLQKQQVQNPVAGIIGNSLLLMAQAISPHIFPYARDISFWVVNHIPKTLHDFLARGFPRFEWQLGELPQEEMGGLGLGITLLVGTVLFARLNLREAWRNIRQSPGFLIGIMSWAALLAYMVKLGNEGASRLLSSYYPLLLIPILMLPGQAWLVRQRWWKIIGILSGVGSLLAMVLTPSRPLWPAEFVCNRLAAAYPQNSEIARARKVYATYMKRNCLLTDLSQQIPDSVTVFGLIGSYNDPDASLWQPYGKRQAVYLTHVNRGRPPCCEWVVIEQQPLEAQIGEPMDDWLKKTGGAVVARELVNAKVSQDPVAWCLVHFTKASAL
jgi:hypothetical protein